MCGGLDNLRKDEGLQKAAPYSFFCLSAICFQDTQSASQHSGLNLNKNKKGVLVMEQEYQDYFPWEDYPENNYVLPEQYLSLTPQDIKSLLEEKVINQDEALKKVSVMLYQHFRGHRFVGMLAGPTGSGKTYIAEAIRDAFPDITYIRDISNVTCDGWTGGKKVNTLFYDVRRPHPTQKHLRPIIFLDECDKMFKPRYSHSENVSEAVQSEFLSVIHGTEIRLDRKDERGRESSTYLDTSRMSFLFAGAFEKEADKIAAKESKSNFGFVESQNCRKEAYERKFTMDDVHNAGCIRELCGRIGKVITLNKLSEDDYIQMLNIKNRGPVHEMEKEFGISIKISFEKKLEIAHNAYVSNLGVRGMKNAIREYIDELTWTNCNREIFYIQ